MVNPPAATADLVRRFALAMVPTGAGMWAAHLLYHLGAAWWNGVPGWMTPAQLLLLDAGLLLSLYVIYRIGSQYFFANSKSYRTRASLDNAFLHPLCSRRLGALPANADEGNDAMKTIVLMFVFAAVLSADGGAIQFRRNSGALTVTLFSTSTPLRPGVADLSVMLQDSRTRDPVLGARVTIRLAKEDAAEISADANHILATNKLLYAASLTIPTPGTWRVVTQVESQGATLTAAGTMEVFPPEPPIWHWWPYFAVLPASVILFGLNQKLKAKQHASAL